MERANEAMGVKKKKKSYNSGTHSILGEEGGAGRITRPCFPPSCMGRIDDIRRFHEGRVISRVF